ncbi:DUF397 domain-containing protein [Streptomyces griseorubiginosus]|uniref:DUF397 domain-containing protein n=1 Tax=Streptomyces griseorubiginosus TaxID=67304 RepID=UPI00363E0245
MGDLIYRKSSRSMTGESCVEVGNSPKAIYIRDSKNRQGAIVKFTHKSWGEFLKGFSM